MCVLIIMRRGVQMAGFDQVERARDAMKVWARWLNTFSSSGVNIDWSHSSAFIHADEPRDDFCGAVSVDRNPLAEYVELNMLGIRGTREYKSLKLWYYVGLPVAEAASDMGVSERGFRLCRERGEYYMAGRLVGWRG